jgi:hypothetical protein
MRTDRYKFSFMQFVPITHKKSTLGMQDKYFRRRHTSVHLCILRAKQRNAKYCLSPPKDAYCTRHRAVLEVTNSCDVVTASIRHSPHRLQRRHAVSSSDVRLYGINTGNDGQVVSKLYYVTQEGCLRDHLEQKIIFFSDLPPFPTYDDVTSISLLLF